MSFAQPFPDYEILDRVGAGAMGTVFKARHQKLDRIVALKVLRPSLARDARYVDRLRREARIVASLNHPNIVTGYDVGEQGGYHFFVMEFVEGKSLRALLAEWGMFPESQVMEVAVQVASALDHAYQRGVIHRDVKPGNILIDERGRVKLTDMGLAKGPLDMAITREGATVGTPQYISPEQARTPQDVDVRSDLYSLGATLYHMATGQPPFRGGTMAEVITKVLHEQVPPPRQLNPDLSVGLDLVIRKLLAKDPALRYQTPRELLDDLERVRAHEAPQVDPADLVVAERVPGRVRWWRLTALAGVVLAALLGIWAGSHLRGEPAAPDVVAAFLVRLDQDLAGDRTWGERWTRLKGAAAAAPGRAAPGLREREAQVLAGLQRTLDDTVQSFAVERRGDLEEWLRDPHTWPPAADFDRELLTPVLRSALGLAPAALPAGVDRSGVDALRRHVAGRVGQRDEQLLLGLDQHMSRELAQQAEDRLRQGDFAGAARVWEHGLADYADGGQRPGLQHLPEPLRKQLRERFAAVQQPALAGITAAAAAAAGALVRDAEAGVAHLAEQLAGGSPPAQVLARLQELGDDLRRRHPPPAAFPVADGPWPGVQEQLAELERRLQTLVLQADQQRLEWYLTMAWRSAVGGALEEAVELLDAAGAADAAATDPFGRHRAALAAADEVAQAILAALAASEEPPVAYHRSAPLQPIPVRVTRVQQRFRLTLVPPGAVAREAAVTEFLLRDLLARAERAESTRLARVPEERRTRGLLVLAMLGDELNGMAARLRSAGDEFLLESVWPRIAHLRSEQGDGAGPDRREAWARVLQAWQAAQTGGALGPLAAALSAFRGRIADADLTAPERRELLDAEQWLQAEQVRRDLLARLQAEAPAGAVVEVRGEPGSLLARIGLGLQALRGAMPDGWELVTEPMPMIRATPAALADPMPRRCSIGAGLQPGLAESAVLLDLWLSPEEMERALLLEFRGVGVLVSLVRDGSVGAALLDPAEATQREPLQRALRRAVAPVLAGGARPRGVPGGVHRLAVEVLEAPRARARVRVLWEEQEVAAESRDLDPRAAPVLRLLPQPGLGLVQVQLRGRGL